MKDKPDKPYFLPKLIKRLEELGVKANNKSNYSIYRVLNLIS